MTSPLDKPAVLKRAIDALGTGDWSGARSAFEQWENAGPISPDHLALLAYAYHRLGDAEGAHAAVDRALALDGTNLRALLTKADLLSVQGETRAANLYYGAVVRFSESSSRLTPDLAHGVRRARAYREKVAREMRQQLRENLLAAGYDSVKSSGRFTHALDLLEGRRQAYLQQPSVFYYPELPNIQFFAREQFGWLEQLESETDAILSELNGVLSERNAFDPYLTSVPGMINEDYPLIDSMDWSSCFLSKDGKETAEASLCPRTMAAVAQAPLCRIPGRSPQIMFSQLRAGAHIRPHTGVVNTRLVCHLPLIVPDGCAFRVGNETRRWEKGKAWVFDDTIEHEARNESDQTRVVLIFDIWRPELSLEERELVTALLHTIDSYSPTDWT